MEFWSWLWDNPLLPRGNLLNLELIGLMYNTNPGPQARFDRWLRDQSVSGFSYETRFAEGNSVFTRSLAVRVFSRSQQAFTLIVSLGTQGTQNVLHLLSGWRDNQPDTATGASYGFDQAATQLAASIGLDWFAAPGQTFYFMGHSYGGAQLSALKAQLRMTRNNPACRLWTYGSPRPGNGRLQQVLKGEGVTRWYNDNDPVRSIPPHSNEAPLLTSVIPGVLRDGFNNQVQPFTGYALHVGGTFTETETMPNLFEVAELNVAGWLSSNSGFAANTHSLDEYVSRFSAMELRGRVTEPVQVPVNEPDMQFAPTNHEQNSITRQAVREIATDVVPSPIEGESTVVRPGRYKARKLRLVGWCVALDGEVIEIVKGKRMARKRARMFNLAARQQRAAMA